MLFRAACRGLGFGVCSGPANNSCIYNYPNATHPPRRCRCVLRRRRTRDRSRRRGQSDAPDRRRLARESRRRLLRIVRGPQVRRPLRDADRPRASIVSRGRVRARPLQRVLAEERRNPQGAAAVHARGRRRERIRHATGLRLSIGGGTNKLIAKMAVDRAKPSSGGNGVMIVEPGAEEAFLRTCTLADIPLVGPKFQARLAAHGLVTVADVLRHDLPALEQWLSKREAAWLWNRAHGSDEGTVAHREVNRGLSRDETFGKDLHEDAELERELLRLVTQASADLRGEGLSARTIAVKLRDFDFKTRSAQHTLREPVVSDRVILETAHELLAPLPQTRRGPARPL